MRPADQRVLIVDDSLPTLRLLRKILEEAGYQVWEAANATEALERISQSLPDLILLDVMMPGISGFELCQQLKQDPTTAAIPIIMVTALSDTRDRVRGLEAGADDFLGKPFDRSELLARSRSLLEKKHLAEELRRTAEQLAAANAQLKDRVRLMSNLLSIGHRLREGMVPEEVHSTVSLALSQVAGVKAFSIFQRAVWRRGWRLTLSRGLEGDEFASLSALESLTGLPEPVLRDRAPYFHRPAEGEPPALRLPGLDEALPIRAALPLVADEQLVGVLVVHEFSPQVLGQVDEDLLQLAAQEIGAALYNLSLYNRMRSYSEPPEDETATERQSPLGHQLQRLSTVAFFSGQLHATLDFHRLHDLIRRLSLDFIGAERLYVVFEYEQERSVYMGTARGLLDGAPAEVGAERHSTLVRRVMQAGVPYPERWEDIVPHEAVAVPLKVDGRVVGAIVVENLLPQVAGWTEQNWELLRLLAQQAAVALMTSSLYRKMSTLAITDGLTGLFNHRHFHERLAEEWARAQRYDKSLSLLMVEADNFKQVNDTYGHLQGDAVLRDLASLVLRSVRDVDIVSRYGGDEFTVILPETNQQGARTVAERIRKTVEEYLFPTEEGTIQVTVSVGVASHPPIEGPNALIRAADNALYRAKRQGKNRVMVAS